MALDGATLFLPRAGAEERFADARFPVFRNGTSICGTRGAAAQICRGQSQREACVHSNFTRIALHERLQGTGTRPQTKKGPTGMPVEAEQCSK